MDFGPDKTGVPGLAGDTETILRRCIDQGLVGGESFAVDASLIKADANRQKGIEGEKGLPPEAAGHAIEEYLAVLDDAAFGAATEIVPKFISPADPAARWTGAHGGQAFFAYSTNYLIDVEHAIIVDVEATPARTYDEVTKTMIERTEQRLDLKPDWLTADTAYGTGKFPAWLSGKSITPHIPVWERYPSSDGMFSRSEFTYDVEQDVYICPNGKLLRTSGMHARAV